MLRNNYPLQLTKHTIIPCRKKVYFAIDVADAKAKCRCWLLIRSFCCFQAVPSPRMAPTGNARHQKPFISGEGRSFLSRKVLIWTGGAQGGDQVGAGKRDRSWGGGAWDGGIFLSIVIIIDISFTIAIGARAGGGRPERCGRHIGGGGGRGQFPSGQKDN